MEKTQGGQVLRDLQTMCHNRSDESVPELISELRTYLARFPGDVPETSEEPEPDAREATSGRDRQERSGITRRRR